jgi:hypothetical protein
LRVFAVARNLGNVARNEQVEFVNLAFEFSHKLKSSIRTARHFTGLAELYESGGVDTDFCLA